MLKSEKEELNSAFNAEKHHLVVAMNIILYLSRWGLMIIDNHSSQGKKFMWVMDKIINLISEVARQTYETFTQNLYISRKNRSTGADIGKLLHEQVGTIHFNYKVYMLK